VDAAAAVRDLIDLTDELVGDASEFFESSSPSSTVTRSLSDSASSSASRPVMSVVAGGRSSSVVSGSPAASSPAGAGAAAGSSLRLRLPRLPSFAAVVRASAAPVAVAPPRGAFPFHRCAAPSGHQLVVPAAATSFPSFCSFDPAGVAGPTPCVLRFGPSPTLLEWRCSHADCPLFRPGAVPPRPEDPHFWCEHQVDLCVICADTFVAAAAGSASTAATVPLVDPVVLVYDAYGRETVTEVEGESACRPSGSTFSARAANHLPFSVCRVHVVEVRAV